MSRAQKPSPGAQKWGVSQFQGLKLEAWGSKVEPRGTKVKPRSTKVRCRKRGVLYSRLYAVGPAKGPKSEFAVFCARTCIMCYMSILQFYMQWLQGISRSQITLDSNTPWLYSWQGGTPWSPLSTPYAPKTCSAAVELGHLWGDGRKEVDLS